METMKCISCGAAVLSTEKFCKQCGKPNEQTTEQKTENSAEAENQMNKKRKKAWIFFCLGFVFLAYGLSSLDNGFEGLLTILSGGFLVVFHAIKLIKFKKPDNQ